MIFKTRKMRRRIRLGHCEKCKLSVYSGESFDLMVFSWGADFPGDRPGRRLVIFHRLCNTEFADHSKDG